MSSSIQHDKSILPRNGTFLIHHVVDNRIKQQHGVPFRIALRIEILCNDVKLDYKPEIMSDFYKVSKADDLDPTILNRHPMRRSIADVFNALLELSVGR